MIFSKKQSLSCKEHRNTKAIGKCKVCGEPVCSSCGIIYKEQMYCLDGCFLEKLLQNKQSAGSASKSSNIKTIGLLTILTLIFCGIISGTIALREIDLLKKENRNLTDSRMHLISTLKENNRELMELKEYQSKQTSAQITPDKSPKINLHRAEKNSTFENPAPLIHSLSFNNGSSEKKLISLTFDGGSDANSAIPILDTLHSRNVKATVFLTGEFIRKYPDIVKSFLNEGHEIGNHTYNHPHLTSYARDRTQTTLPEVTKDYLCNELSKNDQLFSALTGQHFSPIWRSPYGEFNNTICNWAKQCGYQHVGWRQGQSWRQSLDSNDWIPNEETPGFKTPSEVLDKILCIARSNSEALNGGIILMHLGTSRTDPQMQVSTILGSLIDSLQQRGYKFVPISEMIQESGFYLASSPSNIHFQDSILK